MSSVSSLPGRCVGPRSVARVLALLAILAAACPGLSFAAGTWQTTLQPRDFDLDGTVDGYYDTVLDLTWLADGNALAGTVFDIGSASNPSTTDGLTDWLSATAWVNQLRVKGVGGWRLPAALDTGTPGCNFGFLGTDCGASPDPAASELAHLFFVTLGNQSQIDPQGRPRPTGTWGLREVGPFTDLLPVPYWSGGSSVLDPTQHWYFFMFNGTQFLGAEAAVNGYALPVRDGDTPDGSGVRQVPLPEWMALAALFLLSVQGVGRASGRNPVQRGVPEHRPS